ncbi:5'-nucleotidase C-terminal domain-containing protein [Oceanirhabdus sp. W0125-5]|uniref:5'-nucleotidase C-terminal domain-containing protein n=1 Tax=Oceanirhabdus sp. W0125-5 TaxID=2999116 RepID=UPI0022F2BE91|nr:5'-nucleotidase C-terminal domain-containing protein [Oceanirhabdus sp. W0125-5]WBW94769.1 5'-nucleotidase C-terminal domain-containing protein [Oceanirhabdus sp. W0125-5]
MNKRGNRFNLFLSFIVILMFFSLNKAFGESHDRKVIDIITINDFHGKLEEDKREEGKNVGMPKIISAVKQYKASNPNTFVVCGGDSYQGSAISNLTYGAPVSEMYKEMGVVASAVGNHEFDWDIKLMHKWSKDGGFDFLGANIFDKRTNKIVDWAKPYKVIKIDGVKIGLIGLTTTQAAFVNLPSKVENFKFEPLKENTEKWVKYLKSGKAPEGKVDAVIALTHVGAYQDEKSKEISGEIIESGIVGIKGLDAVIGGDTHQLVAGKVNDVVILQAYKEGDALGKLSLIFDKKNNLTSIEPKLDLLYKRKDELEDDKKGEEILYKYSKDLRIIIDEVVGITETALTHERFQERGTSVLGKFITDIMRKNGDAQIAVINEGALRTAIPKGNVTVGKLYEVLPFENILMRMELKGGQLKKVIENGIMNRGIGWIEISGAKVYYNPEKEEGNRILEIILDDGTKVDMDKYYSVATNDFMFVGGDKYDFSGARNVENTNKKILDIVIEHFKNEKTIKYEFEQPFIVKKKNSNIE